MRATGRFKPRSEGPSRAGVPRRRLYDNAKVVTLGRDEERRPVWNRRMLDFAARLGFEIRLCRPYRAQTKGKVESGVKYVRQNMWPSTRFTDDAGLKPSGGGVVRRRGQRPDARDNAPGASGYAGRGACPFGQAAQTGYSGAISERGPQSGTGRLHQLGGFRLLVGLGPNSPARVGASG